MSGFTKGTVLHSNTQSSHDRSYSNYSKPEIQKLKFVFLPADVA
jgi:hypothetical protein